MVMECPGGHAGESLTRRQTGRKHGEVRCGALLAGPGQLAVKAYQAHIGRLTQRRRSSGRAWSVVTMCICGCELRADESGKCETRATIPTLLTSGGLI